MNRAARIALVILLFCLGVIHWLYFFNFGRLAFSAFDWPKEYKYYSVLRQALLEPAIPYHISEKFQSTDRFLALPETNLSPQIILLPHMNIPQFILFNTLLLYSIGFFGCLLIKRKYKLSFYPFTMLFLLFNFNGYITSHLAVGHSMWNGYFLLPFFCLFVLRLLEEPQKNKNSIFKLSILLFIMVLQGSFHIFVWCLMFLVLIGLFNRKIIGPAFLITLFSIFLSAFRLMPAAANFYNKGYPFVFISGYPGLFALFKALIAIKSAAYFPFESKMGWWEFDAYVSIIGLAALVYFGIYLRFSKKQGFGEHKFKALDLPLLAMVLLSLNPFYGLIAKLPLPFLNSQRFSSRFIIIPLVFLMIISAIRLQRSASLFSKKIILRLILVAAILLIFFSLGWHSHVWRIAALEQCGGVITDLSVNIINRQDALYKNIVKISLFISLAVIIISLWIAAFKDKRRACLEKL